MRDSLKIWPSGTAVALLVLLLAACGTDSDQEIQAEAQEQIFSGVTGTTSAVVPRGAAAGAEESVTTVPPLDQTAVTVSTYPAGTPIPAAQLAAEAEQFPAGELETFEPMEDKGDPAEIEKIRRVLPELKIRDLLISAVPPIDGRASLVATEEFNRRQADALTVWAPAAESDAARRLDARLGAFKSALADPNWVGYSDASFAIERWLGVQIDGATAVVIAEAHEELLVNPSSSPDVRATPGWLKLVPTTWRWELAMDDGAWKLVSETVPSSYRS
jgi:hypothetical protein